MAQSQKHIVIFSHGFGVRWGDRGLFSDIAASLPDVEPVLFDYNEVNEAANTLTVRPFSEQAELFKKTLEDARRKDANAIIDVICHSQGALPVALAKPEGIRTTILLAPSFTNDTQRMVLQFENRPGTEINLKGISKLARADGSTTIVPAEYWAERARTEPVDLYNALADHTELVIIIAKQDEILGHHDVEGLNEKITIKELDGAHSFAGEPRKILIKELEAVLRIGE